jgi:hypothetical protein
MRVPDYVSGLLILALGLGALFVAQGFPTAMGQPLGPATFPTIISSLLAAGGLLLIIGALRRRSNPAPDDDVEADEPMDAASWAIMALIVAMPAFYALAAVPLGFLITAFAVLFVSLVVLWGGLLRSAAFAIVFVLLLDFVFRGLFGIPLQQGLLSVPWW